MFFSTAALSILLLAATEPVSAPSPLDRFDEDQRLTLAKGDAAFEYVEHDDPEKEGLGHGKAYAILLKPIDACFAILIDLAKKKEYFPRNVKSEIVKREGDRIWQRERLDFFLAELEYVLINDLDRENHRLDFRLDKSYPHDLAYTEGYWRLERLDADRTLLTYAILKADVGIPVPEFIVKMIASGDLPDIARRIKKRVESDGRWKSDDD